MLSHRDYEAWIVCNDDGLPCYKAHHEGRVASAWVASSANKPFSVQWRDTHGGIATFGVVYIDGVCVGGHSLDGTPMRVADKGWCRTAEDTEREFVFADLVITDDDKAAERDATDRPPVASVGLIELRIERIVWGERKPKRGPAQAGYCEQQFRTRTVHESKKKLGGHQTGLGASREARAGGRGSGRRRLPYDPLDPEPYVVFRFYYRPHDVLQANGIIPPPPRDESEEAEAHDCIDLTVEDDKALVAPKPAPSVDAQLFRLQALEAELLQARQSLLEQRRAQLAMAGDCKVEPINADLFFLPGEVIDLTDE